MTCPETSYGVPITLACYEAQQHCETQTLFETKAQAIGREEENQSSGW